MITKFFDRIICRFKESDAEFYTNYQTARKVTRPSYRSKDEAEGDVEAKTSAAKPQAQTTEVIDSDEATYAEVQAVLGARGGRILGVSGDGF